ncbi:MAG: tRNA pseudouridine(38-40) synthase TruA [Ignavibacteriales bacterium]|nr:tRNA pseudouridine(38-40) synthase TruA [Ignavibacteriales bacterium]
MQNYKLTIRYQGTKYHGWQMQQNAVSVQATIKQALELLLKEEVNLIGAGRTDTGVHAMGQVANFRTDQSLDLFRFIYSLNSLLPKDISITHYEQVPESFHSRYDATSREYRYHFYHKKNPFLHGLAFYSYHRYDVVVLNKYAQRFLGTHDFYSFSKELPDNENATCTIKKAVWRCTKEMTVFTIIADRYLHGMVRLITGSIIYAAKNKLPAAWIDEMLTTKQENRFAVPPCGLYLYNVKYD